MNKVILTLCLFALMQLNSNAEDILRPYGRAGESSNSPDYHLTGFDGKSPISFGIEGGANLNFYGSTVTVNQAYYNKLNAFLAPKGSFMYYNELMNVVESGFGVSPHIGIFIDVPINEKSGIGVRVSYDSRSFSNSKDGFSNPAIGGVMYGEATIPFTLDYKDTYDYAGLNLNYRYNFTDEFFMTFGVNFDFLMSDKGELTFTSNDPNYPLIDTYVGYIPAVQTGVGPYAMTTMITTENSTRMISSRLGLEVGANYKIEISKNFALVPYARFQFFATKPFEDEIAPVPTIYYIDGIPYNLQMETGETWSSKQTDAYLHTLQLGLSLWFNF